jgi:hypothetical protein
MSDRCPSKIARTGEDYTGAVIRCEREPHILGLHIARYATWDNDDPDLIGGSADSKIIWQYAFPDPDEPDGIMPLEGTPRAITPKMLRRPLRPVGLWRPVHEDPTCTLNAGEDHHDCECNCHGDDDE